MSENEKRFYKLYQRLHNRVHKGSPSKAFNQAMEMLYHLDMLITMRSSEHDVYLIANEYDRILYDKDKDY